MATDERAPVPAPVPSFEDYPLTRIEYITAMVHFYRAEMQRAQVWRTRLDTTTNWSLVTAGGMLSFAFSQPEHSHVTLLLSMLLLTMFLVFEARRYRYFDVWRSRVRMIEENFFIPIIRRNLVSPRSQWRESIAADLDEPKFKVTYLQATAIRLERNYVWIFLIVGLAWFAKLDLHPTRARSFSEVIERMRVGPFDGIVVLLLVAAFYGMLLAVAIGAARKHILGHEIHGVEKAVDHWKM